MESYSRSSSWHIWVPCCCKVVGEVGGERDWVQIVEVVEQGISSDIDGSSTGCSDNVLC